MGDCLVCWTEVVIFLYGQSAGLDGLDGCCWGPAMSKTSLFLAVKKSRALNETHISELQASLAISLPPDTSEHTPP